MCSLFLVDSCHHCVISPGSMARDVDLRAQGRVNVKVEDHSDIVAANSVLCRTILVSTFFRV